VSAQYKKLTKRENEELRDIPNNLTQDLWNPVWLEVQPVDRQENDAL
jgi:hypothetical protein